MKNQLCTVIYKLNGKIINTQYKTSELFELLPKLIDNDGLYAGIYIQPERENKNKRLKENKSKEHKNKKDANNIPTYTASK